MSDAGPDGPKLYTAKPKKAHLKQVKAKEFTSPPSMETPKAAAAPPPPPTESFARRYKFLWPLLLTVNLAVGAYLFMRTKKDTVIEDGETAVDVPSTPTPTPTPTPITTTTVTEKLAPTTSAIVPPKVLPPIQEDQQRELFKWILEEKRKMKPKDPEEKKRIDEEKAILKQFIRSKSIPNL